MTAPKIDPNRDPNLGPANDNGGVTPAANPLATSALTALTAAFKRVDISAVSNRPLQPLLQFKSREGGIWTIGQKRTIPEPDSKWAVNPTTFQWGWVCWGDASKILGEKLVPVDHDLPDVTTMPDKGFPWMQEMAVNLKCISGIDVGAEVVFKTNTQGGRGEITQLIAAVQDRLGMRHEGNVVPIVRLENSSYPHREFGKTYVPVMPIVDWMGLDGPELEPAPEPASPPPSTEQPRRRRVAG